MVKRGQVSVTELELECGDVLLQVGDRAGSGDQQHSVVAGQQPGQRNLRWRGVMLVDDFHGRPLGAKAGRATEGRAEWSPGHEGNLVLASKGDQIVVVALEVWSDCEALITELEVSYTRLDGSSIALPCCNVFRLRDGLVADCRVYMDINPVYE
jgi:hypothetical protein